MHDSHRKYCVLLISYDINILIQKRYNEKISCNTEYMLVLYQM